MQGWLEIRAKLKELSELLKAREAAGTSHRPAEKEREKERERDHRERDGEGRSRDRDRNGRDREREHRDRDRRCDDGPPWHYYYMANPLRWAIDTEASMAFEWLWNSSRGLRWI